MNARFIVLVFCIVILIMFPVHAAESPQEFQSAGALYSTSVDLANAGKYTEALQAADQALVLNISSLTPLIQANRAGILTVLGRHTEAIAAADAALAAEGNLTTTHAIAWYNKGDALRHLGRMDEAKTAFEKAQALDPTLIPPEDVNRVNTMSGRSPLPTKTPLPGFIVPAALALAVLTGIGLCKAGR